MARLDFAGAAALCSAGVDIGTADTSISLAGDVNGWPTGLAGRPFMVVLERGTTRMEKIMCSARVGTTLTISQRGADGTTSKTHGAGSAVEHCFGASTLDDYGRHVYDATHNDHSQYVKKDGTTAFTGLAAIADPPVSVGTANAEGSADTLARSDHVHALGPGAIADGTIDENKIAGSVAGAGLGGGGGSPLIVNADGATLEVNADVVRLKDGGIAAVSKFGSGVRPVRIVADATALAALTGMASGDLALQQDTHCLFEYSGTAWRGISDVALGNRRRWRTFNYFLPLGPTGLNLNAPLDPFPAGNTFNVAVPAWATKAITRCVINQTHAVTDTLNHTLQFGLGTVLGANRRFRWAIQGGTNVSGSVDADSRQDITLSDSLNVTSIAGTTVAARTKGNQVSGTGSLRLTASESDCTIDIEFLEAN